MSGAWRWVAVAVALLAAVYFVGLVWAGSSTGVPAYDIYTYMYPILLYARQRLADGGGGLLWNPFQNCGQPFFGISSTGLLYPANAFFLLLNADHALYAVTIFNLTVAGVSAYLLLRELGVGPLGCLTGALAFELSNASVDTNTFGPLVASAYVWYPAMLWAAERVLRAPSRRGSVVLAAVCAVALLPGFPQAVVFAYELIALRVLWALAVGDIPRPRRALPTLAAGLALAPLLVAVQYLPGLEMARLSVRSGPLSLREISAGTAGVIDWAALLDRVTHRSEILNPLLLVPCMVASWSLVAPATRRRALFYLIAGLLFSVLAFGSNTPLFELYLRLPLTRNFRGPGRLLWVTGFCLSVMTGLGIEALRSSRAGPERARRGVALGAAAALVAFGYRSLSASGLWPLEWVVAGVTTLVGFLAGVPPAACWAAPIASAAVVISLASFPLAVARGSTAEWAMRPSPRRRPLASGELLLSRREVFAPLRARMTAQDRAYIIYPHAYFALMAKSAQLFAVPAIQDYEPQPTRRSAEYAVMMRTRVRMRSLDGYYRLPEGRFMTTALARRLFDLAAARYIVVETSADQTGTLQPPPQLLSASGDGAVRVYENPQALPRAFFVPRVKVSSDPQTLLRQLAAGTDPLRELALVEAEPPSGFTGSPGDAGEGAVEFLVDDPERLVLRVDAPQRGFLHLADQYFPGWRATVDGAPTPILPANFLFRAVEVPAGESIVEFRYAPMSVRVGAAVSALAIGVAAFVAWKRP